MVNEVQLKKVAEIIMGQSPPGTTYNERGDGLPFFQGVADFGYLHPTPRVYCNAPSRIAYPGDILLSVRAPIGRVNVAEELCAVGRGLAIIRPKNHNNARFIEFVLRYMEPYWYAIEGGGSVFGNATRSDIEELRIPWLQGTEQRAIAEVLGALDDKIELNRRMNATLEAMAQALFRHWFVDSEEAGDWEESSLEELFGKKSDCVLTGPFGSHLHAHDYRDEGTPLILVKHVMDGHILEDGLPLVGKHKLHEMKRYLLEVGDIVFTRVGAVGRSAYVHPRNEGWMISGQTLRVRVPDKTRLNSRYLAQLYLEPSFTGMVEQHALGTTRPSLNTSILLSFKFLLPPIELQNSFGEFADAIDKKVQQNLDESRTLAALRDALLPKLMRGEVRVRTADGR
jgi:type I restriction enzyme S subunit